MLALIIPLDGIPGVPTHPIAPGGPPPGYWGGVAPPHPDQGLPGNPNVPTHPIVIPPGSLGPGTPTHPIVLPPPVPGHPIVIPPDAISPGHPSHPIALPPPIPGHPIVIPPDAIEPGLPSHPIYLPPVIWPGPGVPTHPIAPGGPPPGFWGGAPIPVPTPPMVPPTESVYVVGYTPGYGVTWVKVKPLDEAPPNAPAHPIAGPPGTAAKK